MADINKIKLPDNSIVNLKDYRISGVDSTPTSGSDNVVTSGGVYTALGSKADASSVVQSDWSQTTTTALDYIKNKPTVDSTPTENSTNLVSSGGVYEAIEDAAFICDDEEAIEYLQDGTVVDVDTKADKVVGATSGNLAGLDAYGNLTDSGRNANSFQDVLTSGTNIKTINGQTILGPGNINISLSAAGLTLDEVADGQTRVIPTNTSDLNNDSGFVQYGENGEISASKFIGPLETSYDDTENNTSMYKTLITQKKVYTGILGVANGSSPNNNTYANTSFYFLTVKPKTWDSQWSVKYRLNVHLDDETQQYKSSSTASVVNVGLLMRGTYDCTITGTGGIYSTFHFFQSQKNTSYRPIYYHMIHQTTAVGFGQDYGHKIGVSLASSYVPTPVTDYSSGSAVSNTRYTRTIEVVLEETINCTAELSDELEVEGDAYRDDYTKLNTTYYSTNTSASNSAGRWNNLAATTQGLYESGNDNTYTYTQQSSNYLKNVTKSGNTGVKLWSYPLIGFNKDGNALGLSVYSSSQSSNTTSISAKGTRLYCTEGFDYTKGIRYVSTSSTFAYNADMNISTQINYSGLDLRYSDNCVPSSTANTLGMVNRKPVYLRGTIGNDGLFYLAPIDVTYNSSTYQRAWVQDIPSIQNEDGEYVYWFIGYPYYNSSYPNALYQLNLYTTSELVWYKNGDVKPYVPNNYSDLKVQQLDDASNSELLVIAPFDEDYVKIVAPNATGDVPHIEIYESGSGDTSFYYDHIKRGSATITFPSSSGTLALTSQIPSAVTESTVSGWGFTKNTGTLTGVSFNGTNATVTNGVASITASIPTVPTISTNISNDANSDVKTASPKAVKTYVDGLVGDIETLLAAI